MKGKRNMKLNWTTPGKSKHLKILSTVPEQIYLVLS